MGSATLVSDWRQGLLANDLKPLLQGSARLRAVRRARIAPASRGGYYRREPAHRCPEDATTMKVVIADDEPLARERLRLLLAEHPDLQLVAAAGDGREALHACAEPDADLVLLDTAMPGIDGLEAARHLAAFEPRPAVVFCTAYRSEEHTS